jgi:hypothetical protein
VRNRDISAQITAISRATEFAWVERAIACVDELVWMVRRNIQKTAALDAMIIKLRNSPETVNA